MSTDRRIRASQQNGAKSHGPVTREGRVKSSANSARHHLLSKTILLENERPEAFAELLAGLTGEFNPRTEAERALVENMAVSRWRQMRIWAIERATLTSATEACDPDITEPATRAALAFRSLADDSRTLDLLNRYETRFERQFARPLNLLMKLADPENPLRRTGITACPSAEAAPLPAQNHFCQTNLIPRPDTDSEGGAGLPACAAVTPSDDQDSQAHSEWDAQDQDPQIADESPAPSEPHAPEPAPAASLTHFPTFIFDDVPSGVASGPNSALPPNPRAAVAGLTSILAL